MSEHAPLKGQNIICIASASWDAMWVNSQHLMSRVALDNRVLYMNNMGLRPPSTGKGDLRKILRRLGEWLKKPLQVSENLTVMSPIALPFHSSSVVRKINRWLLAFRIMRWQKKLGLTRPILWIFLPTGESLVGKLGEKLVVYHCVDDYSANPNVAKEQIQAMEDRLLQKADITIVTSPKLEADKKGRTKSLHYFPNTADVPRFRDYSGQIPAQLAAISKKFSGNKILGYQGNISRYKTDLPLLAAIARRFPENPLVLVGPAGWGDPSTDLSDLKTQPNVFLVGQKSLEELPGWLQGFDVCLIPLNRNESTKGSFPMKFYEYLACAKPVVATNLPAFVSYAGKPELARLADNENEFLDAVEAALAEQQTPELRRMRIAEAEKNDWGLRVRQIGTVVARVLEQKEGAH